MEALQAENSSLQAAVDQAPSTAQISKLQNEISKPHFLLVILHIRFYIDLAVSAAFPVHIKKFEPNTEPFYKVPHLLLDT